MVILGDTTSFSLFFFGDSETHDDCETPIFSGWCCHPGWSWIAARRENHGTQPCGVQFQVAMQSEGGLRRVARRFVAVVLVYLTLFPSIGRAYRLYEKLRETDCFQQMFRETNRFYQSKKGLEQDFQTINCPFFQGK